MLRAEIDDLIIDWYNMREESTTESTNMSLSPNYMHMECSIDLCADSDEFILMNGQYIPQLTTDKWDEKSFTNEIDIVEKAEDFMGETLSIRSIFDDLASDNERESETSPSELFMSLKNRFKGKKGNSLISELVDIAGKLNGVNKLPVTHHDILGKEMSTLLDFSKRRNMRLKAYSQFSLIEHIKDQKLDKNIYNVLKAVEDENYNDVTYNHWDRVRALGKYISKRNKRNSSNVIRYDIRRKLASSRLRVKGKFLKKAKIDLVEAVKLLKTQQ